jgi:hypothetical protein
MELLMSLIIAALTVSFGISYWIYRTARTESVGFMALVAWVSFAALDLAAIAAWGIWILVQGGAAWN